jgi:hypothetical protein
MTKYPVNHYLSGSFAAKSYAQTVSDIDLKLNGTQAFTIEAWVKFNGLCENTQIISKEGEFSFGLTGHLVTFQIEGYPLVTTDTESLQIGTEDWHYICITFSGSNVILYIDGQLQIQQIITGTSPSTNNPIQIGANLQGLIQRVLVIPQAISSDIILQHMFNPPSPSETKAYYDFSVNPPTDQSSNKWQLTLEDGVKVYSEIPATLFSDTGYVQPIRDDTVNPGGNGNDPFTIQTWINVTTNYPRQAVFVNTTNVADNGISLWLYYDDTVDALKLKSTHGIFNGVDDTVTSTKTIKTDEWYNIACSYDGTVLSLFIDGVLDTSVNISTPVNLTDNQMLIGSSIKEGRPSGAYSWQGYIQNIYIWDRALTQDELLNFMTASPIQDNGIKAIYTLDIAPARNAVTGTPLGLCDGADMDVIKANTLQSISNIPSTQLSEDDVYKPLLNETELQSFRDSLEFPNIQDQLQEAKKQDLDGRIKAFVPYQELEKAHKLIGKKWDEAIHIAKTEPLKLGIIKWHRYNEYDVLIHHTSNFSQELYRVPADSLSICTMWKINLIWTIFSALLSITGITARITDKLQSFINNRILQNQPLMTVIVNNINAMNATALFLIIKSLHSFGVLWPLTKMALKTLGWWALGRLLIRIASYFVGAGAAATIAALVVSVAQLIYVITQKPSSCALTTVQVEKTS